MHKTSILLLALAFGYLTKGNAQSTQPAKSNQSTQTDKKMENNFNDEQKKVLATIQKMAAAFEKKDIDGVLATYEANAIVMFEPQKPLSGKEVLRTAFTQFAALSPKFTFTAHDVYISGDIATHIAPWIMLGQMIDGTKVEQSGLSIAVLRKQTDGTWLMIQDNPNGQFLLNR